MTQEYRQLAQSPKFHESLVIRPSEQDSNTTPDQVLSERRKKRVVQKFESMNDVVERKAHKNAIAFVSQDNR